MNANFRQLGCVLGVLLAASGCVTSGGAGQGFDGRAKQADEKLPAAPRFYDDGERKLVEEAQARQAAARKAVEEGSPEKARAEFAAAAERYARFADSYPSSEWRIAFRFKAAEFELYAQQHALAAEQAAKVLTDPASSEATKAMAAQLSAVAWLGIAKQREKAGAQDPIKLVGTEQRGPAPLAPRELPESWRRFVGAVDAYLLVWEKHPELSRRPDDRNLALPPWQAALIAAQVEYSWDQMAEARRRLEQIVQTWPSEGEVMASAAPLLLQSLLALGDLAAFSAARDRLEGLLAGQADKAADAKVKEALLKARDQIVQEARRVDFLTAKRLLDGGKSVEAAEAFERFASTHPASPDAPNALWNAALALDKAEQPEKAFAVREALVQKYGDSRMAPMATLHLASGASKRGDHEGAARYYAKYLERWPEAANACIAMQNAAYELDVQGKKPEAAEQYLAFGSAARCRKERPNEAAKALYRGGKLFREAKLKAKAKEAFDSATGVEGVNDPVAKGMIEDAKRQSKEVVR